MFPDVAERLAILRRMGFPRMGMGHDDDYDARKLNAVVTEVVRWNHLRPRPKLRHYVMRAYWRVVLRRKDWRLPWR